ncbi:hypothetical protein EW026_g4872 [Hermanssonia centrifuga]|uniref:NAD(P)-binding domain-containing protein n=1 Tax=Hermanssonia centrifuga TaxID=98765 RepID=A0A4V3XA76_9APHY|nr:hypothetical protein EW026_g4872 [Hermanssonia centrifuga]
MSGQSALVLGATGATGKHLLKELISSNHFTKIGEYGRRVTPQSQIPATNKLEQKVVDFETINRTAFQNDRWDVIFITLGTTRGNAGSAAAFEKIDREYVLNAARAAKSDDPSHEQRVVYLSSGGANPSSHFLYFKSKGLTEEGLASLGYELIAFRPGFLAQADRQGTSRPIAETILNPLMSMLGSVWSGALIPVAQLAKSMRTAGELGSSGIPANLKTHISKNGAVYTVIDNNPAVKLASSTTQ